MPVRMLPIGDDGSGRMAELDAMPITARMRPRRCAAKLKALKKTVLPEKKRPPKISMDETPRIGELTGKQARLMEFLYCGSTLEEAAKEMRLSYGTVKVYMVQAKQRTNSRTSLLMMARYAEWRAENKCPIT